MSDRYELDQDTWIEILEANEPDEPDLDDFRFCDPAYQEQVRREEQESERRRKQEELQKERESERKELQKQRESERIQREVDWRVNEWMHALIDCGIEFDSDEYKIAHARAIYKFMNELIPKILCPGCRECHICSDCKRCYNCDYGLFYDEFSSGNFNMPCGSCNTRDKLNKKYEHVIRTANKLKKT